VFPRISLPDALTARSRDYQPGARRLVRGPCERSGPAGYSGL